MQTDHLMQPSTYGQHQVGSSSLNTQKTNINKGASTAGLEMSRTKLSPCLQPVLEDTCNQYPLEKWWHLVIDEGLHQPLGVWGRLCQGRFLSSLLELDCLSGRIEAETGRARTLREQRLQSKSYRQQCPRGFRSQQTNVYVLSLFCRIPQKPPPALNRASIPLSTQSQS